MTSLDRSHQSQRFFTLESLGYILCKLSVHQNKNELLYPSGGVIQFNFSNQFLYHIKGPQGATLGLYIQHQMYIKLSININKSETVRCVIRDIV